MVVTAAGHLLMTLMTQSVDMPREAPEVTIPAPAPDFAFHMEQITLPLPPPVSDRLDVGRTDDLRSSPPERAHRQEAAVRSPPEIERHAVVDVQADAPDPTTVDPDEGEQLLVKAERGEVGTVRISWPESPDGRARLDAWLHDCIGVRNALLHRGALTASEAGVRASPSRQFSGLIRRIEGVPVPAEARRLARLRASGAIGVGIRLFPRDFDRALLGTLSNMGALRPDARVRYRFVERFTLEVDGQTIDLSFLSGSGCRA